ncbi:MAG: hypothetical protein ACI31R_04345 [Bacilli bacterium]
MNDNDKKNKYDYDEMKKMFDEKKDKDTSFEAKMNEVFNEEYKKTGVYNGYNVRKAASNTFDELAEKNDFKAINFEGDVEVKKKTISKESKNNKAIKSVVAVLVAAGIGFGTITFVDTIQHPESYFTTHPNFEGTPTFSELIDRTPANFGIGGK